MKIFISAILNKGFEIWQDVIIIMLFSIALIFLLVIIYYRLSGKNHRNDVFNELKMKDAKKKEEEERLKALLQPEAEKKEAPVKNTGAALYGEAELKQRKDREERLKKEEAVLKAIESTDMDRPQIDALIKQEGIILPENFIINALTNRVLISAPYAMKDLGDDTKVTEQETAGFAKKTVADYILSLDGVTLDSPEKSRMVFKTGKRTTAILHGTDEKMKLTVKCGAAYASKLIKRGVPGFQPSTFPKGLIWYSIDNETGGTYEMFRLLADISCMISKAGY